MRPKSTKAHVENTIKLLLSLKEDKDRPSIHGEDNFNFSLNQNIPNPFKPTRFDNSYNLTKYCTHCKAFYVNDCCKVYAFQYSNETRIYFNIEEANKVDLTIYNIYGQKVKTLLSKSLKQGKHFVDWDGKDFFGNFVSDGIYFYTLKINKKRITKKLIYIRNGGQK
ncbi:MAG: T9SS type A sorting domain-containing protein [Bacteroidales bacterium]|nr:T9SS type A sorting domain-containing protein [Bacteroidales bacterium]